MRQKHFHFDEVLLQELIDSLSIAPHLDKPLYMLSTGSRRKVWLAAAFASGAPVTLLDEPFAALDSPSIASVKRLLALAAHQPARVYLIADYEAPTGVPLAGVIDLGD
jgi:ABC-type Mn2+/Zn2+ transport system ATPase subunit